MKEINKIRLDETLINAFLGLTTYRRGQITGSLGVDQSVWSRWESRQRSPSLKKLQEIAPLLKLNVVELVIAIEILQDRYVNKR